MDLEFVRNLNIRSLSVLITTPIALMLIVSFLMGWLSLVKALLIVFLSPAWLFLGIYFLIPLPWFLALFMAIAIWLILIYLVGFMFYYRKSLDLSKFHSLLVVYGLVVVLVIIGFLARNKVFGIA